MQQNEVVLYFEVNVYTGKWDGFFAGGSIF